MSALRGQAVASLTRIAWPVSTPAASSRMISLLNCRSSEPPKPSCINLKTVKALGVTVPLTLSGRADELFE